MDYLQDIGMQNVHDFERDLGGYLYDRVGPSLEAHGTCTLFRSACETIGCVILVSTLEYGVFPV